MAIPSNEHFLHTQASLRAIVKQTIHHYLFEIDPIVPLKDIHKTVMEEIEIPLIEATLDYTKGHLCQAADILGIHRTTLRKKLAQYHLSKKF